MQRYFTHLDSIQMGKILFRIHSNFMGMIWTYLVPRFYSRVKCNVSFYSFVPAAEWQINRSSDASCRIQLLRGKPGINISASMQYNEDFAGKKVSATWKPVELSHNDAWEPLHNCLGIVEDIGLNQTPELERTHLWDKLHEILVAETWIWNITSQTSYLAQMKSKQMPH